MELTPRPAPARPARRRRSTGAVAVLVVVLAALGFIVFEGLSNATLYFYNADEAVAHQHDLGTKRFRIQGTVADDVRQTSDGVEFHIAFNGTDVAVRHVGDPPQLFKPGIPVVLEGHWAAGSSTFASDRIMVKHSAAYVAKNSKRLQDAANGGTASTTSP